MGLIFPSDPLIRITSKMPTVLFQFYFSLPLSSLPWKVCEVPWQRKRKKEEWSLPQISSSVLSNISAVTETFYICAVQYSSATIWPRKTDFIFKILILFNFN